ncbi:gephyrin-like molybdotransferase receptor GlpR [Corynebacterium meitnerae]|uniref:Transmembrane protein n=1 Tax=Corynebacterium meitnerae TaxID=2913498 RepID=A0A9X3LU07_9CORY|nr:gephyrin-like molybdotransferase receptor GlpR [Corynebacterium meitnerae]MCZ9293761.1 hypothetical protein [Corynebacterium meitnerae]
MSGSLSLIIVLIVVVWAIVLAPMVLGDSKPIRRAGEGFDETRVLHQGGTAAIQARRRPRVTAADVHRHDEEDDYEVVVPEEGSTEAVLIDDSPATPSWKKLFTRSNVVDAEPVEDEADTPETEAEAEVAEAEADTADTVDAADAELDETLDEAEDLSAEYDYDDSYLAPEDFGYSTVVSMPEAEEMTAEDSVDVAEDSVEDSAADSADDAAADSADDSADDVDEATLTRASRGRGGWTPEAEKQARAERLRRRERTLLGLITVTGVAFIWALISGGWVWLAPLAGAALLVWYMSALRSLVTQERALRERRLRQLRRARLGVVSSEEDAPLPAHMRRPGAVIVELDDESADFANLPEYHDDDFDFHGADRVRESA